MEPSLHNIDYAHLHISDPNRDIGLLEPIEKAEVTGLDTRG
jgi:hypothetical protein